MKKILTVIFAAMFISMSSQEKKEYHIMCFEGSNSTYFYIIKHKGQYYYNFTAHMVADDEFKKLFWKKSSSLPIDTSAVHMIGNTKIREDQLDARILKELEK